MCSHNNGNAAGAVVVSEVPKPDALTLRIISVNDVYLLENFAHLDGVIKHFRTDNTIVTLPGDFLSPSFLSSLDKGKGMIDVMNATGIEYVCFGNHETDVGLEELKKRIKEFKGVWINTNMPEFAVQLPTHHILEFGSDHHRRKIALLGLLTADKNLYLPGAFGGAAIQPIVETAVRFKEQLHDKVDLVIPMTHQVIAQDRDMAKQKLGFPLLLAAHDHDPYVEVVEGCNIVKVGCDATKTAIIDITWPTRATPGKEPTISVQVVETKAYPANEDLLQRIKRHMKVVEDMEKAALFICPKNLSSLGMRLKPTTVGTLLCSTLRIAMQVDGVMLNAGCIRGNTEYPQNKKYFTYADLKKELPFDSPVVVIPMSGAEVKHTLEFSRRKALLTPPEESGGYQQTDDKIQWTSETNTLTHVAGKPIELEKVYRIAVLLTTLQGVDKVQPLIDYAATHPAEVPIEGMPVKNILVEFFAREIWMQVDSFKDLDIDGNGYLAKDEVRVALQRKLGVEDVSETLVTQLFTSLDTNKDEKISEAEFNAAINSQSELLRKELSATDLDENNDGIVSREELRRALRNTMLGREMVSGDSEGVVAGLQKRLDSNRDGKLQTTEMGSH